MSTHTPAAPVVQPAGSGWRWHVSDALALAGRNLAHVRQIPEKLIDVTLQPLMFVLLFAFVFGGVIHVPGGDYHEYLLGGILVQTLAFGMMGPGTSIATDMKEGIVDRFRSLPMSRSAFLLGHLIAEMAAVTLAIVILTVSGLIVGWRIESDVPHALAAYALTFAFAFAMIWLGMLLGLLVREPDAVMGVGFLVVFPLTFVSNAFVPADGLPSALQTFAEWNPVSAVVAAVRTLFGNPTAATANPPWPLAHPVPAAVFWCVAITAIAAPLAVRRYRARILD
jgi:ABC-2 type transport system permease protein